jgi:CheY-like chemotaxis protein
MKESGMIGDDVGKVPDEPGMVSDEPVRLREEPGMVGEELVRLSEEPGMVGEELVRLSEEPEMVGEELVRLNEEDRKRVIRCLIADDDADEIDTVRELLVSCRTDTDIKIGECFTAEQAVDRCRDSVIDVVFLDVIFGAQRISGLQAAALILKERPKTVIVIRGNHAEDTILAGLRLCNPMGAKVFFMPKSATDAEAREIVCEVLRTVCGVT